MPTYKILIADDELLARQAVKLALPVNEELLIVAECSDGTDAVQQIKEHLPDIIFLDIQMPGYTGLEVMQSLPTNYYPYLIIVSAFDNYAVRAYEYDAADYLLKPFTQQRFDKAFDKALKNRNDYTIRAQLDTMRSLSERMQQYLTAGKVYKDRLSIKEGAKIIVVPCGEVLFLEAKGDYISVSTTGKKYLHNETLSVLENTLDPSVFVRIHRSCIVNVNFIKELNSHYNGDYTVVLKNNEQLKLSRNYRAQLLLQIG